ncbi:hypothetical protein DSL72_005063 [Monilinia vaccinii-corymbosi]|uniref:Protein kinase domain-containing protein n=1 Tax=Monilinia vaccinii-corymbosi TaxID=61207 RepID=A0A8A3PEJ6_9HELO|nr:hypothetical protein DSL72_005063 [Monilinia vaccinii-corymbosi]
MSLVQPGETGWQAQQRLGFNPNVAPLPIHQMSRAETAARSKAWLKTEHLWTRASRMGSYPAWRGVKLLGEGGNGTAGKWELTDGPLPGDHPHRLPFKSCVIKQQSGHGDMENEARIYELLRHIPSQHLVMMYRRLYEDQGFGTVLGDRRGIVRRIYLEDCEQGDLWSLMRQKFTQRKRFEEYEIWDAFHCMARGLYAMHYGHEELDKERWDRDEIVHFDFKAPNVFVGAAQNDEEHKGTQVLKIGDYGHSVEVPADQDLSFNLRQRWQGTDRYKLPEQLRSRRNSLQRPWMEKGFKFMRAPGDGNVLNNFRFGTHSNVWQLGLVMWKLMHCIEWCEDGNEAKPYQWVGDVEWDDKKQVKDRKMFQLKLYPVSSTWLGLSDKSGKVHTLATQDDIDYYNGEYDDLSPDRYDYQGISEADQFMNRKKIGIENRRRAQFRKSRPYSDTLHKLVMDCLIVQQESRIHVDELYRKTQKFKDFWVQKVGPIAPAPYFPQPRLDLKRLPEPWNDMTREPGEGLGRPVPDIFESHKLSLDDLFHATKEYEQAAAVRQWAQDNPIEDPPEADQREALAAIERNRRHFENFQIGTRQFGGQRNRPVYQVPDAFPRGLEHDDGVPGRGRQTGSGGDDGEGGGGRGGGGAGRAGRAERGGRGGRGGGPGNLPSEQDIGVRQQPPPGREVFGGPDDSESTPDYLKNMQSTPEHMKGRLGHRLTPPELRSDVRRPAGDAGGDLGGLVDMGIAPPRRRLDEALAGRRRSRSKGSSRYQRQDPNKRKEGRWPKFPVGLQPAVDKKLLRSALKIPELRDSIMFCTVVGHQGGEKVLKGIVYLVGLRPDTTALQIKEMLTAEETGILVDNMKLVGNDRLTVYREFEDDEPRSAMYGIELVVSDITKMHG